MCLSADKHVHIQWCGVAYTLQQVLDAARQQLVAPRIHVGVQVHGLRTRWHDIMYLTSLQLPIHACQDIPWLQRTASLSLVLTPQRSMQA